ncbi:ABC transporter family protein [Rhodococcus sp. MTM3W5.2]|uniref:ATP-binding cassette domain-containing protein n=1 Tax=Rhodococcus sp. MTM3W5.2 TaxID=1805827 RepID=UPI0009790C07|nr:ABC transporter ATP-binding protein [Rhodococcus sp. MTM3W5.2]AQA21548.1 ABC transporter family protein [Rhodococcus sp. MTM3W5.2]
MTGSLVEVSDLTVRAGGRTLLDGIGFSMNRGERLGLIGESGSGKSLTALSLMGLLPDQLSATGSIALDGVDVNLVGAPERLLTALRGDDLGMVFQEPMTALNPLMKVGRQVAEVIELHDSALSRAGRREAVLAQLAAVDLPDPARIARSYPHELSGGQRQRVLIAIAMANRPRVLICDEPSTALDVTVQAQILDLIDTTVREHDTALLFITHDLAVVSALCDRVLVMRDGSILESGPIERVFGAPQHPYTRALLEASDLSGSTLGDRWRPDRCRGSARSPRRCRTNTSSRSCPYGGSAAPTGDRGPRCGVGRIPCTHWPARRSTSVAASGSAWSANPAPASPR